MLVAVRNKTHIQKLKTQLKEEFDMKDLEDQEDLRYRDQSRQESTNFSYPKRIMFSRC